MKISHLIPALVLTTLPLLGCDKKPDPAQQKACEDFAKHLAEVIQTEQGEKVPQEQVDKMVAATTEQCLAAPPEAKQLECAMAAKDSKTLKACDPAVEEEPPPADKEPKEG